MADPLAVAIGAFAVASGEQSLVVHGLGSCVALVLHDPVSGAGGLAHILLPGPRPSADVLRDLPAKYADEALSVLCEALEARWGNRRNLRAGLVGGARLFASEAPLELGVGARNVQGAVTALERAGVPLRWRDTGGSIGRTLRFELPVGRLHVRTLREGWREILDAP